MAGDSRSAPFRCYKKFKLKPLILLAIFIGYVFAGAAVFQALEQSEFEQIVSNWTTDRVKIRKEYVVNLSLQLFNNSDIVNFLDTERSQLFVDRLLNGAQDYERILSVDSWNKFRRDWSYWNATLYALALVTTVGAGDIRPTTFWGRLFALIYALLGVPWLLWTAAACAEQLLYPLIVDRFAFKEPRWQRFLRVFGVLLLLIPIWLALSSVVLYFAVGDMSPFEALSMSVFAQLTVDLSRSDSPLGVALILCYTPVMFVLIALCVYMKMALFPIKHPEPLEALVGLAQAVGRKLQLAVDVSGVARLVTHDVSFDNPVVDVREDERTWMADVSHFVENQNGVPESLQRSLIERQYKATGSPES